MSTTVKPRPVEKHFGIGNWTEGSTALRLVVTVRVKVGDEAGDLAARNFETVDHEPVEPGTFGLSFTHEVYNRRLNRDRGMQSCGAGIPAEYVDAITTFDEGWDREQLAELQRIGERWHLNDMRAACSHMGGTVPVGATIAFPTPSGLATEFTVASYAPSTGRWVDEAGEPREHRDLPDVTCECCGHTKKAGSYVAFYDAVDHYGINSGRTCSVTGYRYGSAWLVEPVPADVWEYLERIGLFA